MLPGQKRDGIVLFEFAQEAHVSPINPHPRSFLHFAGADELDFSHHLTLRTSAGGE